MRCEEIISTVEAEYPEMKGSVTPTTTMTNCLEIYLKYSDRGCESSCQSAIDFALYSVINLLASGSWLSTYSELPLQVLSANMSLQLRPVIQKAFA